MYKVKIFISQPMSGKTYRQILADREEIIDKLHNLWIDTDIEVLNTVYENITEHEPLWYLGLALQALSEAEVVVFSHKWWEARGCNIEYRCASLYGKNILLLENYI